MHAYVVDKYGPPEVLRQAVIDTPVPKENEVLVRVHAATVTVADVRMRAFRVPGWFWLMARLALGVTKPRRRVPGAEYAGVVVETGAHVTQFKVGDRVCGTTLGLRQGSYAEHLCADASRKRGRLAAIPDGVDFGTAAALPVGALTALHFLRVAKVGPGTRVVVYGASGSVGTYAVQLAKHFGAHVTAVCSAGNADLVRSLGADRVLDYRQEDFTKSGETWDVVFDTMGFVPLGDALRVLSPRGEVLLATPNRFVDVLRIFWQNATGRKKIRWGSTGETSANLAYLLNLVATGKLRAVIDRRWPIGQLAEAHRYVDLGHKKGNVVVDVHE